MVDFRSKEKAIKKRDPRLVHVRYNSLERMNVLEVEWGLQPIIEHINLSAPSHAAASPAAAGPLDPNSSVLELGEEVTKLNAAQTPERDTLPALLEGADSLACSCVSSVCACSAPATRENALRPVRQLREVDHLCRLQRTLLLARLSDCSRLRRQVKINWGARGAVPRAVGAGAFGE